MSRDLLKKETLKLSPHQAAKNVEQLTASINTGSVEHLLPLMFTIKGNPYTLKNQFPFAPFFNTDMPKRMSLTTGRQLGKTQQVSTVATMRAALIPHHSILFVMPLYEQTRRLSHNYIRPLIEFSPIKKYLRQPGTSNSVLERGFSNGSRMTFSFAGLDCDRTRGIPGDELFVDEAQDMQPDFFPILDETLSASKYGIRVYTGTPKTFDNPIHTLRNDSSQAEWFTPCRACGKWNIASVEYDLLKMIGPVRSDISEQSPGVICAKCRRPISPREGRWVHRFPDRRYDFPGYHIPQVIMPGHYAEPGKWRELVAKSEGWGGMSPAQFHNEVLGESYDLGQKLVTETDLRNAATLPWANNPKDPDPQIMKRLNNYRMRVLAVDWSGGGDLGVSYTVISVLGLNADNSVDVLWGKRLTMTSDHVGEAEECLHWFSVFKCRFMAHDYTGAGVLRETFLVNAGVPLQCLFPVAYVPHMNKLIQFHDPSDTHSRGYYQLNKTRSLLYTAQSIKQKLIRFFKYDHVNDMNRGLLHDFLTLAENKIESRLGSDIYTITRNLDLPDDFAHTVNVGAACLWHSNDAWPDFAKGRASPKAKRQARALSGVGWTSEDDSLLAYSQGVDYDYSD